MLFDPADVLPGIGRRLRKLFSRTDSMFCRAVVSAGDLARIPRGSGVDDNQILKAPPDERILHRGAPEILRPEGPQLFDSLNERLRLLESFKMIARRDYDLASGRKFKIRYLPLRQPMQAGSS